MVSNNSNVISEGDLNNSQLVHQIFVIADTGFYVDAVLQLIRQNEENTIIGCTSPGDECRAKLTKAQPDVVLVHKNVFTQPVPIIIQGIKDTLPEVKILVFGQEMDEGFLFRIISAGASGYINEKMTAEHLQRAISAVTKNEIWAERHILSEFVRNAVELEQMIEDIIQRKIENLGELLSKRESEIFELVLKGMSTKEIADYVCLSQQSVKFHLGRIFKKFDVTNRSQLILLAFERVCPVSNMIRLFRSTLDKHRLSNNKKGIIHDPLKNTILE